MSVKVVDLTHIYGENTVFEFKALDKINFEVEQGEFIGIIGHTGSGKSTMIKHLNKLLEPTSGEVFIEGESINQKGVYVKDLCHKIGIVFQNPEQQLFEETVFADIAFGPKNIGIENIEETVRESMEMVGLDYEKYKDKAPYELSGGQKRRVAIAGVVAMNPNILILDEPASGLDPIGRKKILDRIMELHRTRNLTTFVVSHSMTDICEYASKIMVFSDGKLMDYNSPENIFKNNEQLEEIGLGVPEGKQLLLKLKERGIDINTDLYKFEDVVEEIKNKVGNKNV